ncbi:hypothetical protein RCL1_005183 [Eukaryota sp. TZLM3-RCL]
MSNDELLSIFRTALDFVVEHHSPDLDWVSSRSSLCESFEDFFEEYCYVVIASGFRGKTAAKLVEKLVPLASNKSEMLKVFNNSRKINAISTVYQLKDKWNTLRISFKDMDSLKQFPYIGDVTKYHLARNIGLVSCVKPDLHLVRLAESCTFASPLKMVEFIKKETKTNLSLGAIDFVLWIFLSHDKGKMLDCCNGGFRLR